MHKTRLNKVAYILVNLPQERKKMVGGPKGVPQMFDMGQWYKCGTKACAIGYAAMHPWFRQRGLELSHDNKDTLQAPICEGNIGISAVTTFFDITYDEAEHLFDSDSHKRENRADVAQRIRAFVRNGGRKAAA